jgi:hypothetical protein
MDTLVEKLNAKLQYWKPAVAEQVRQSIAEIIELADQGALNILHDRSSKTHLRAVNPRKLTEFRGILPATRPYPGQEALRQQIGESLGIQDVGDQHE